MGEDVEVDLGTTQGPGTRCSRPVWIAVAVFSICALLTVLILAGIAIAATAYQPSGDKRALLIVGGRPSHLSTTSILQLGKYSEPFCPTAQATTISSFPFPVSGIRIAESGGYPVVCGGLDESSTLGKRLSFCYSFSAFWGSWSRISAELEHPREAYGLVQLNEQDFMIAGGFGGAGEILGSTEVFSGASGSFSAGPDLPENLKLSGSCWIKLNQTHFVLTGGSRGSTRGGFSKKVFLFDYPHKYFSELPSLSVQRSEHGCGLVRKHKRMPEDDSGEAEKEEELELVVVGGVREASTEIYNFKTKKWRMGQGGPNELSYSASVPFGDTFLLVGGLCQAECEDADPEEDVAKNYPAKKLLEYDPVSERLIQRNETLGKGNEGLYLAGAIFADRGLFGCD